MLNSFDDQTAIEILEMLRWWRGGQNSQVGRKQEDQLLNDNGSWWAHIIETVPKCEAYEPREVPAPTEPLEKNPDFRIQEETKSLTASPGRGRAELYRRNSETGAMEKLGPTLFPVFNFAYHPIPTTWFVPLTSINGDLYCITQNLAWHLLTPSEGIPPASGDLAGSAECEIWRVGYDKRREPVLDPNGDPIVTEVLNWHPRQSIPGNTHVMGNTQDSWVNVIVDYC